MVKKMGGQAGKEWRVMGAQQLANWRLWGGPLRLDNVLRNGGLRRPSGIVMELVEVRSPLNEVKKGRGNEGRV
jgi:hypothetical protein